MLGVPINLGLELAAVNTWVAGSVFTSCPLSRTGVISPVVSTPTPGIASNGDVGLATGAVLVTDVAGTGSGSPCLWRYSDAISPATLFRSFCVSFSSR